VSTDRVRVLAEVAELIRPLTDNLLPGEDITPDMRLGMDLGLQSLALANLSGRLQTRYGPATNIVAFLGARPPSGPIGEITVGEFADYIVMILNNEAVSGANGASADGLDEKAKAARLVALSMRAILLDDPDVYAQADSAGHSNSDGNTEVLRELAPEVERVLLHMPNGDVEAYVAGQGSVVLLMHQSNVGAGLFARQFARLAGQYKLICVHMPGVGATMWESDLTVGGLARLWRTVLTELSVAPPYHVLGSSFGGVVAQEFVLRHQDECAALILAGASYRLGSRSTGLRSLELTLRQEARLSGSPDADLGEAQRSVLRCESMDTRIGLKYLDSLTARPGSLSRLADVTIPTLIVRGQYDTLVPERDVERLTGAIPGSRSVELPGAGHFLLATHAQEVNDLVEPFLADRIAARSSGASARARSSNPVQGADDTRQPGRCIVLGTGRCGSTMLSRLLAMEQDTLSVSESMVTIKGRMLLAPDTEYDGSEYWTMISRPHGSGTVVNLILQLGFRDAQYCYPENGRFGADRVHVPPILRIALPGITPDPDGLFDYLAACVPEFPQQTVALHHRMLLDLLANTLGRSRWVERTGASSTIAYPWLLVNPDAKVVHLTRNVDDTVKSMSKHPAFQLSEIRHEFHARYGVDPYIRAMPGTALPDDLPDEMRQFLPGNITAEALRARKFNKAFFEQLIAQLEGSAEQALADLQPAQLYKMRYEDIRADPVRELTRLGEFLEFPDPSDWASRAAPQVRTTGSATHSDAKPGSAAFAT
jgi:putative sulfotransferase